MIYSPTTAITQGTDYDTVGTYESAIAEALGTGVGLLDQLPADAQWIDSVGTVEGGSGDRDRVATPPSLGAPGIHVHHPTSVLAPANTAVAADAISRRFGQTLPNSIGVWYNGDISNGTPSRHYHSRIWKIPRALLAWWRPTAPCSRLGLTTFCEMFTGDFSIRTRRLPRSMAA